MNSREDRTSRESVSAAVNQTVGTLAQKSAGAGIPAGTSADRRSNQTLPERVPIAGVDGSPALSWSTNKPGSKLLTFLLHLLIELAAARQLVKVHILLLRGYFRLSGASLWGNYSGVDEKACV